MPDPFTTVVLEREKSFRGLVAEVRDGTLLVSAGGKPPMACDVLSAAASESLEPGDTVLVAVPEDGTRPVVLGRIATYRRPEVPDLTQEGAPAQAPEAAQEHLERKEIQAEEIVIQAGRRIALQVGETRLVLEEDGKIVIQGKNIISRARALNKIRGGVVTIN